MYLVYCIEVLEKDYEKANSIMEKYDYNNDIAVKSLTPSRLNGVDTVQYWFTCTCSGDIDVIANELKSNGIDVF
jgi:hypothetical protein